MGILVGRFHNIFKRTFAGLATAGTIFAATPSAHTETIGDHDQSPHQDKETIHKDINTKGKSNGIEISIQMHTGETIYAGIITIESNFCNSEIKISISKMTFYTIWQKVFQE